MGARQGVFDPFVTALEDAMHPYMVKDLGDRARVFGSNTPVFPPHGVLKNVVVPVPAEFQS